MKILWNSVAPWIGSGYGQQSSLFVPKIRDAGHDVALSVFCGLEGTIGGWDGMTVYPADHTRLNKYRLREYAQDHAGDGSLDDVQIITLMDVWTWIDARWGGRFGGVLDGEGLRIAAWVPIDHYPIPPGVVKALETVGARPIAMSRFGESELKANGFDPLYVPHGVDTTIYRPRPDARAAMRAAMDIPEDGFLVGMVANNTGNTPPRKAFPQVIQAFSALSAEIDNAYLYLHCEVHGIFDGINLMHLLEFNGVPMDRVRVVDQYKNHAGSITPNEMAALYSAMDVLANPSYGEGFGIPIIEAQACGTPVIVTDWTAMPELVGEGWKVQGDPWYDCAHGSYYMCPGLPEILAAMREAYEARDDAAMGERAREFALGYDADLVMQDYWLPALAELEGGEHESPTADPVEVPA